MPPITFHMVVARQVAIDLATEHLSPDSGHYLLGATSPDIRVLTRQDRFSTHFFDLNEHNHQDSVATFLETYGHLAAPERLNPETRAWAAGYISHLVLDEQYITGVYRPYFLQHHHLGGAIRANVMDRLLQFDLDRRFGSDPELKQSICAALSCTVEGIACGFIDSETLERWRQVSHDVAARNLDWDRARAMIANHLRLAGLSEGETMEHFLDSLPELLGETIAHITDSEIDAFVQRATDTARAAVERYLGCT
ncbi:zinc dependent phospholipase C family protein [Tepidiforma sp.]|uniref:zinc dependent phospholipase C family protein n=1 Tax=Tepidiforma sp. TaxID=2682230 RepID=UPI002ADE65C4|nr:zinc dependent phospholipase C family protein [Tepidiforma sp.]